MDRNLAVAVLIGTMAVVCLETVASDRTPSYRYHFVSDADKLPFTFTHYPDLKQYGVGVRTDRMDEKLTLFSMGVYISQSELKSALDMHKVQQRVGIQGSVVVDKTTPAQFQYWNTVPDTKYAYAYCTLRTEFDFDQYIVKIRTPTNEPAAGGSI